MKKLVSLSVMLSALLLSLSVSAASGLRIAVLDMHEVMQKSTQVKDLRDSLQKKFKSREASIISDRDTLQKDAEKLDRDKAVLSKNDLESLKKKVEKEQQDLQKKQMQFQQDVMQAQNEALKTFIDNVKNVVKSVASDEKYEIVLTKDTVAYAEDGIDITAKVLKKLEKK